MRIACLFLVYLLGSIAQAAAGPKVVVPEPVFDFGEIALGSEHTHEFVIRNEGDGLLEIQSSSDKQQGAVVAVLDSSIAPGGEGRVRVAVDTFSLDTPTLDIKLSSNDPVQPEIAVKIKALVRAYLVADPGFARYEFVQKAREGTVSELVWADDGTDFRVLKVTSPLSFLRLAFHEASLAERVAERKGRQWSVNITIAADAPVGAFGDMVVVETDHPKQNKVWIPVTGFVRPMFAVTPAQIRLTELSPLPEGAAPATGTLFVKNFADETVELVAATSDVPGITATIKPVVPGRTYNIVLSLAPRVPLGPFSGTLVIKTASPKQPTIEVPISGTLTASQKP